MISRRPGWLAFCALSALASVHAADPPNGTLVFQNLRTLVSSFRVDNPDVAATSGLEGPKGLAAADLDGDGFNDLVTGNHDGTVSVLFGVAGAAFEPVRYLATGASGGLRDVITANVMGDGRAEIIAANPFEGKLYIFTVSGGAGSRSFSPVQTVQTWPGARAVAAGDFNGDGVMDLAVAGAGGGCFREYRGHGAGGFTPQDPVASIPILPFDGNSAKPVFALHPWKKPGETRDRLLLSYAGADRVWFLASEADQPLAITYRLPLTATEIERGIYDLAMAYVSQSSRDTGEPDLITAVTDASEVLLRFYTPPNISPYSQTPSRQLSAPGGPRAVTISDVNGDTWPDLLVVARQGNTLSLYLNKLGTLSLASQTSTGSSPRDVVSADFDGNGQPDAAVINRQSQDITVHRIEPATGSFLQSPLVQLVSGGATAPSIVDMDRDGSKEMLYLAPATGEASIQKIATANGISRWVPPVRYSMGTGARTLSAEDVNGDGRPDLISTSLGDSQTSGGLRYRLQLPDGTFAPLINVSGSPGGGGAMIAEIARDFNRDGRLDLLVAKFDGGIDFYEGTPAGLMHRRTEVSFVNAGRALAAADIDQDGDFDLIGVAAQGDIAVVENNGQWFTGGPYRRTLIRATSVNTYAVNAEDVNGDGDPDLTIFAAKQVSRWSGAPGLQFQFVGKIELDPVQDETELDFDGDGIIDRFLLGQSKTKLGFYKGTPDGSGLPEEPFRGVPSANELASGDLDGDGKPDLIGAGEYLWAALSATRSPALAPVVSPKPPIEVPKVVINEVLASTRDYIATGATKPVDCVEIFNGSHEAVNLSGWSLRRTIAGEVPAPDFVFGNFTLDPGDIRVVYCTDKKNTPWNTRFKLPEGGATLTLVNSGGEVDSLTYPPQQPDVSYARLSDGARSFVFNAFPSIGGTNYDSGVAPPNVTFKGLDMALLQSGKWRFRARAWTPHGMFTMNVFWREVSSSEPRRSGFIPLYDDGMHDDGSSFDGSFAGDWDKPLPVGTPIEFYVTGTDLRWESATVPDSPQFTPSGLPIGNYTLLVPAVQSGWEISEVVPVNNTGLKDERGQYRDWLELRYTGSFTIPVEELFLADSLFGYDADGLYNIKELGSPVPPSTVKVVYLDGTSPFDPLMPRHAPFKVRGDGAGDSIYLIHRLPSGVTELVDWVKAPPSWPADAAYARTRPGGPFAQAVPTPEAPNARRGGSVQIVPNPSGGAECLFVFPGGASVEASDDVETWTTVMPWVPNNGIERVYRETMRGRQRFFRER